MYNKVHIIATKTFFFSCLCSPVLLFIRLYCYPGYRAYKISFAVFFIKKLYMLVPWININI